MPTLQQLEALVLVADNANFKRAGDALGLAQPTISRSVKLLEDEFGRALFDRSARTSVLNADGRDIVTRARRMLQLRDQIKRVMSGAAGVRTAAVRIGVPEIVAATWLGGWVDRVRARHDGIGLSVVVAPVAALMSMLESGGVQVAVIEDAAVVSDVRRHPLPAVPQAVFGSRVPLSGREPPELGEPAGALLGQVAAAVAGTAWVVLPRDIDRHWRRAVNLVPAPVQPGVAPVQYAIAYRAGGQELLWRDIALAGKKSCDFSRWASMPIGRMSPRS